MRKCCSCDRAGNRYPAVSPSAVPLILNWEYCMSDAGSKVTCRIDGITGRSTKGHTDRHDQECHWKGSKLSHADVKMLSVRVKVCYIGIHSENEDDEYEKPACKCLTEEIAGLVAFDCRHCAECT